MVEITENSIQFSLVVFFREMLLAIFFISFSDKPSPPVISMQYPTFSSKTQMVFSLLPSTYIRSAFV